LPAVYPHSGALTLRREAAKYFIEDKKDKKDYAIRIVAIFFKNNSNNLNNGIRNLLPHAKARSR